LPAPRLRDRPGLAAASPVARAGVRRRARPGPGGRLPLRAVQRPRPVAVAGRGAAPVRQPAGHHPQEEERLKAMHDETIAIHGGYTPDGTRAVAVPIYQTVAHD